MAQRLADIWLTQAGSGARARRTEAAQTTGVAECGNCDRRDDEESALTAGVGADGSRLCCAAAADDLRESLDYVRIDRM